MAYAGKPVTFECTCLVGATHATDDPAVRICDLCGGAVRIGASGGAHHGTATVSRGADAPPGTRGGGANEGAAPSRDDARRRARELVALAVDRLLAAGMVSRGRHGATWHLGLPGRSGTLRVSDHAPPDPHRSDAVAGITFVPTSLPPSEDAVAELVAAGFGRYLLETGGMHPGPAASR